MADIPTGQGSPRGSRQALSNLLPLPTFQPGRKRCENCGVERDFVWFFAGRFARDRSPTLNKRCNKCNPAQKATQYATLLEGNSSTTSTAGSRPSAHGGARDGTGRKRGLTRRHALAGYDVRDEGFGRGSANYHETLDERDSRLSRQSSTRSLRSLRRHSQSQTYPDQQPGSSLTSINPLGPFLAPARLPYFKCTSCIYYRAQRWNTGNDQCYWCAEGITNNRLDREFTWCLKGSYDVPRNTFVSLDSAVEGTTLLESQYVCILCLTHFGPVTGSGGGGIGSGSDNSYDNNDDDNRGDNIHGSRTGSDGESGTNPYLEALLNSSDPPLEHPYHLADSVACTDLDFDCIMDFEKHIMHHRELRTLCIDCKEMWFFQDLRKTGPLAGVCRPCRDIRDPPKKRVDGMPKLMSATNNMDPGPDYTHWNLPTLSKIEALLIARVHCSVQVWSLRGVSWKSKAHCIHFPREVDDVFVSVPLYATDIEILVLKPAQDDPNATAVFEKQFRVRRNVVAIWCKHLLALHPGYRGIVSFNEAALSALPVDSSILDQLPNTRYESTFDGYATIDQLVEAADEGNEYVSVPNMQVTQTAVEELRERVGGARTASITWLRRGNQPLSEYDRTLSLISCALPELFPVGAAEPNMARMRHVSFYDWFEHMLKYCDNRFAQYYSFRFIGLNISMRMKARATSTYFVRQHPDHAAMTADELRAAFAAQGDARADALLYSMTRWGAGLQGTRAYWGPQKTNVTTYVRAFGPPGGFFTFSAADLHWLSLMQHMPQYDEWLIAHEDEKMRIARRNLRDNPHIADYHLARRVDLFCKHVLFKKFNVTDW